MNRPALPRRLERLAVWPLPALLTWAAAWAVFAGVDAAASPAWLAWTLAIGVGAGLALTAATPWRRLFMAAGFPLSLAVGGGGSLPGWAWLVALGVLALVYPVGSWRDAPLFPTPAGALRGLGRLAPLPAGARVVDAGCGLGAGLRELRSAYPDARLSGLEWSWPLRLLSAWRCPFASVRRADIWAADWSGFDMVYLFQRPESMPRAADKAGGELRPGAWLASLEFEARQLVPDAVHRAGDGKPVWLYRAPLRWRRGEGAVNR